MFLLVNFKYYLLYFINIDINIDININIDIDIDIGININIDIDIYKKVAIYITKKIY